MSTFVDFLHEVFEQFGPITTRRMFGGHGVYHDGVMFALIADDTLYLKTDSANLHHFEQAGLDPFRYDKNGTVIEMSYSMAPEEIMEDRELAATWAHRSFEAATRSRHRKRKRPSGT